MAQRNGSKSLSELQDAFKKGLLNQSKVLSSVAESRSSAAIKNHAYDHLMPTLAEGGIHINTEIYRLIQFLKEKDCPVSLEEIKEKISLDLASRPDILRQVSNNDRIQCNLPFLQYRPMFNIRNKDELLIHLKKHATISGFDTNSIKEIFPKVNTAVQDLINSKLIMGLGPKEDNIHILFYNDLVLPSYPDSDVKQLWHGQIIPDEHDLQSRLHTAGLKGLEVVQEKPKLVQTGKKPSSNRFRRVKMTNTHLEDFDFSKEYTGE